MSNTLFTYHDNETDLSHMEHSTLLLMVAASHFSLAVVKSGKLDIWINERSLESLLHPDEQLDSLLKAQYNQVIAGAMPAKFTLWPSEVLQNSQIPVIACYLNVDATESVFTDKLDQDNAVIYTTPQTVTDILKKYNLENQVIFGPKGWITAIASNQPADENLYVNICKQQIDILYLKEGKVRFYNRFKFDTTEELTYYTLLAVQELELDLKITSVKLTGDVEPADENISRLAEFFKSAGILDIQVVDLPSALAPQHILALSALNLCASLAEV